MGVKDFKKTRSGFEDGVLITDSSSVIELSVLLGNAGLRPDRSRC